MITLTEGDDIYYTRFRGVDVVWGLNMLGGNDQLFAGIPANLIAWLGAGNDYAKIGTMYDVVVYGEGGNDTVDLTGFTFSFRFEGGDGADRVNFLVDKQGVNILGSLGNDSFYGNDHLISGTIDGGAGDDLFIGFGNYGGSQPTLAGGTGNDTYYVNPAAPPTILENASAGNDTIVLLYSSPSYVKPANIENLIVQGGSPPPPLNTITGDNLDNVLIGGAGPESIYGLGGNDTLRGNGGDDWLEGGTGNDTLRGGAGADRLYGGDGADRLRGEAGRDEAWGGLGADQFVFDDAHFGGASAAICDVIHDFSRAEGDRVRLNEVDANKNILADQAFAFIGTAAFGHVAGQLRYEQIGGNTYIQGDLNGDAIADFWIGLDGLHNLVSTDFWL